MAAAPPQMRRIPTEQFFDLRNWSADKAEDYGGKASMVVHTMITVPPLLLKLRLMKEIMVV